MKAGFLGHPGSGKTMTASKLALGLSLYLRERGLAHGPVNFIDSETGSDWMIPRFKEAGVKLRVLKTRAFQSLIPAIQTTEDEQGILIIDSVTHFWRELVDSYIEKLGRKKGLLFQDWAAVKAKWWLFTDLFVNSQAHISMCGRAGYEYDHIEDESGKRELVKTDIKMKAEGETGYEPSLLVLMERQQDIVASPIRVWRTATILKDRSTILDGKQFVDPDFKEFLPHVEFLNLGGVHVGVNADRSGSLFDDADAGRRVLLDEIKTFMVKLYPGSDKESKSHKLNLMERFFDTTSWAKMETLPLETLRMGFSVLKAQAAKEPV
jgi:hypothetical protein